MGAVSSVTSPYFPMLYESPCTMNGSWGYKYYDCDWKPAEEILRIKNKLNGMGCNYLLNVGPDHLGRIPAPCVEILRKAGEEADLTN